MSKLVKIDNKLSVSDNKLAKFVPPVYHVNLMPTENGTYSASTTSGYTGTDVTLYNTPDSGYVFDRFEIDGSELWTPTSFDLYRSDVNVHCYFIPASKFFYQYSESSMFTNKTIDLISLGMDPNATQRYLVFYQDVYCNYGSNNGDAWYYLQSDSYQFFRTFARRLNATLYREAKVQNTGVGIGTTTNTYKIIYDRLDLTAKVYINGGLSFTGTVTEDPVTISKVVVGYSWASCSCNNLSGAGFNYLEDAEAWDGSPF